tara:strand:- start:527 stop:1018 length:492 start_codon:yes stop_codon:yes gene_type:complete
MTRDKDFQPFEIELQPGYLSVSNFSSLLRVFQVTMREVSRNVDGLSTIISDHQNPVLRVEADQTGRLLTLKFCFFDGERSTYLSALSHQAFQLFFDEFGEYIKKLPQRGLWGESVAGPQGINDESEVVKRLDQLRVELRRLGKAQLRYQNRRIFFEGDRMELV